MQNQQLLKSKLLNSAEILNLGQKSKILLKSFIDNPNYLTDPQESFIQACQTADLIGPESLTLASRLKCEHIIKGNIPEIEVDSIVPKLMVPKENGKVM